MPVLGITGGVASGKSTFTGLLAKVITAELFDADKCVHELLENDVLVAAEITQVLGRRVADSEGRISRARLRELVFTDPSKRKKLEAILHPRVQQRWMDRARTIRNSHTSLWLFVDLPLLFETGAEPHFDRTVVIAASEPSQIERIIRNRNLDVETACRMITSQLPMSEKIRRAGHVIWNDGCLQVLREQAIVLSNYLASVAA